MKPIKNYKDAGVDIDRGDRFVEFIKSRASRAVSREIGGFAGGIPINTNDYKKPLLFSTTDGVGTKIVVAKKLQNYSTIGIDLVAMCVNDLLVCNVMPLSFLDYIACGSLDESIMGRIIEGVIKGCEEAGCQLSGGETAELPDLYGKGDFDLAGFCVGIGDGETILPRKDKMKAGDLIFGLPSSGIHSNGLSLARKIVKPEDASFYEELLTPTKIYRKELEPLLKSGYVKGAAHITGGGLINNVNRILPKNLAPHFHYSWSAPPLFDYIQRKGKIDNEEMYRVFNMGIGVCLIISPDNAGEIETLCRQNKVEPVQVGVLNDG